MGLKDLFIKSDEEKEDKVVQSTKKSAVSTSASTIQSAAPSTFAQTVVAAESPEFVEYFNKAFSERNFPGPDYYEFMQAMKTVEAMAIADSDKFKMIFAGFKAQGITVNTLVETAGKYLGFFKEKHDLFTKATQTAYTEKVGGRQTKLESLKAENDKIDQEMQRLTEKKLKNNESVSILTAEIGNETMQLDQKKA